MVVKCKLNHLIFTRLETKCLPSCHFLVNDLKKKLTFLCEKRRNIETENRNAEDKKDKKYKYKYYVNVKY